MTTPSGPAIASLCPEACRALLRYAGAAVIALCIVAAFHYASESRSPQPAMASGAGIDTHTPRAVNRTTPGAFLERHAVLYGVMLLLLTGAGIAAGRAAARCRVAEAQLHSGRRIQERFRHCVEAAPNAMILTDREGRIVLVNRLTETMFGYGRGELLGHPVEMLIPAGQRDAHVRDRADFTTRGGTRIVGDGRALTGMHRDGSTFPAEIGLHSVDTDEGRMVLAVVTDVTARRRLEAGIAWRDRQLAQHDALIAVGRMANMVAHDIRNPLSSIKMGLQIIGKRDCMRDDAQARELNSIALEQVGFVEEVVEDLMTYSRDSELNPRWLDLAQVIDSALAGAARRFDEHDVRLRTDMAQGLPAVRGDRTRLRRVFSNLIANALDATGSLRDRVPEIRITVGLYGTDAREVRVEIRDNADGVASADLERIFEPFFTTREQGTGLGLAISKQIVEQHGGRLEIAGAEPHGTCATVFLPINHAAVRPDAPDPSAATASPRRAPTEDIS